MTFSMLTLITALGWIGAVAGIVAYGMASKGRWDAGSLPFQVTNLAGATLMFLVAAVNGVWPSAAANVAWIAIGGQAVVAIARRRAAERTAAAPVAAAATVTAVAPVETVGTLEAPAPAVDVESTTEVGLAA